MKFKYLYGCVLLFTGGGCLFSGNDIEEKKLVEPYYITTSGISYDLIIKERDASTNKVVITNIDSIGWNESYIFGKTVSEYFIINQATQILIGRYNNRSDFNKVIEPFSNKMKKTDEL